MFLLLHHCLLLLALVIMVPSCSRECTGSAPWTGYIWHFYVLCLTEPSSISYSSGQICHLLLHVEPLLYPVLLECLWLNHYSMATFSANKTNVCDGGGYIKSSLVTHHSMPPVVTPEKSVCDQRRGGERENSCPRDHMPNNVFPRGNGEFSFIFPMCTINRIRKRSNLISHHPSGKTPLHVISKADSCPPPQ